PLLQAAPAQVVVANRSLDRAHSLVQRHAALATRSGAALSAAPLNDCGEGFDVVINATASSLLGAAVPVAPRVLRAGSLVLDMMYGHAAKGFLAWAIEHGAEARDGLGMLVEQAAEAFFVWRGVRPDTPPVLDALRHRLNAGAAS
ncbi:MAG TPA: shikimate dehydrogenase, partial [Rhizobacter sp.]|nr:shikimate dehydrogenase [Rhizobacter sp.]